MTHRWPVLTPNPERAAQRTSSGYCPTAGRCYISGAADLGPGVEMLDAYIINKIRQERESRDSQRQPLRIEVPRDDPRRSEREVRRGERRNERGDERREHIIDFTI